MSVLLTLIFIKPQDIKNIKLKEVPIFEFSNFNVYKITKDKLDLILVASSGNFFKEKTMIENLSMVKFLQNSKLEYLTSKTAMFKDNIFFFQKEATYTKNDGVYILTNDLIYNLKDEIIKSNQQFKIDFNEMHTFNGDEFTFYKNENKFLATNVKAVINLK